MKKRIAYISEHASPLATLGGIDSGGQNVYVDQMTKNLAWLGYEVDVFTRWDNPQLPKIVDCQNGVRVIHIKAGPVKFIPKEKLLEYMGEFTENMLEFITNEGEMYNLIHANFFMSGQVAADIKKTLGIPFVVTFHALGKVRQIFQGDNDKFPQQRVSIEERVINEADQIIAECPQDMEDLIIHYHANQDKITIIPCGYDPNEFYPMDKQLAKMTIGVDANEKVILHLGRMVPRKGVDNVIRAFSLLKQKTNKSLRLLIVGGESENPDPKQTPEIGRLMQIAKEEGVLEYVKFVGSKKRDQLRYYYNAADVFVDTPWYEPFGITPLEAMASGTPVIGSEVGGIKFTVVDEKTGYLVPAKDPKALAEKIEAVISDPKRAQYFKENGIKRVQDFFTWSTVARSMMSLYEKLFYAKVLHPSDFESQSEIIEKNFSELVHAVDKSKQVLEVPILDAARVITQTLQEHNRVLVCGNGGSATDASHFAVELVGHYQLEKREALPVIALNTDTAILTAVGNDFSFDKVFSRQVEALGSNNDVLIGISTGGNSENVIKAFVEAKKKDIICIGLLGNDGGKMLKYCDIAIVIPSQNTQTIPALFIKISTLPNSL